MGRKPVSPDAFEKAKRVLNLLQVDMKKPGSFKPLTTAAELTGISRTTLRLIAQATTLDEYHRLRHEMDGGTPVVVRPPSGPSELDAVVNVLNQIGVVMSSSNALLRQLVESTEKSNQLQEQQLETLRALLRAWMGPGGAS